MWVKRLGLPPPCGNSDLGNFDPTPIFPLRQCVLPNALAQREDFLFLVCADEEGFGEFYVQFFI